MGRFDYICERSVRPYLVTMDSNTFPLPCKPYIEFQTQLTRRSVFGVACSLYRIASKTWYRIWKCNLKVHCCGTHCSKIDGICRRLPSAWLVVTAAGLRDSHIRSQWEGSSVAGLTLNWWSLSFSSHCRALRPLCFILRQSRWYVSDWHAKGIVSYKNCKTGLSA